MTTSEQHLKFKGELRRTAIDLENLPQGQTYEDRYQGYLKLFGDIANMPPSVEIDVYNCPYSWAPIMFHMNCNVKSMRMAFDHCALVCGALQNVPYRAQREEDRVFPNLALDRTAIEVLCSFRPETADGLWKCDMQWRRDRMRAYPPVDEFIVTTNGAFHRREVLDFMEAMNVYRPKKRNVVLVPCAADKPYPSPMHQRILDMLPDDYYLANVTGVLGVVPQDMWNTMPHYDSGIPNRWRVFECVREYFMRFPHDKIILYCDFYGQAIAHAIASLKQEHKLHVAVPIMFYYDYLDLLDPTRLDMLQTAINEKPFAERLGGL